MSNRVSQKRGKMENSPQTQWYYLSELLTLSYNNKPFVSNHNPLYTSLDNSCTHPKYMQPGAIQASTNLSAVQLESYVEKYLPSLMNTSHKFSPPDFLKHQIFHRVRVKTIMSKTLVHPPCYYHILEFKKKILQYYMSMHNLSFPFQNYTHIALSWGPILM